MKRKRNRVRPPEGDTRRRQAPLMSRAKRRVSAHTAETLHKLLCKKMERLAFGGLEPGEWEKLRQSVTELVGEYRDALACLPGGDAFLGQDRAIADLLLAGLQAVKV